MAIKQSMSRAVFHRSLHDLDDGTSNHDRRLTLQGRNGNPQEELSACTVWFDTIDDRAPSTWRSSNCAIARSDSRRVNAAARPLKVPSRAKETRRWQRAGWGSLGRSCAGASQFVQEKEFGDRYNGVVASADAQPVLAEARVSPRSAHVSARHGKRVGAPRQSSVAWSMAYRAVPLVLVALVTARRWRLTPSSK
jgi:hypothetical protein